MENEKFSSKIEVDLEKGRENLGTGCVGLQLGLLWLFMRFKILNTSFVQAKQLSRFHGYTGEVKCHEIVLEMLANQ